jgi:hypothetical protein
VSAEASNTVGATAAAKAPAILAGRIGALHPVA